MKTAVAAAEPPRQAQLRRVRDVLVQALRARFDTVMGACSRIELPDDDL